MNDDKDEIEVVHTETEMLRTAARFALEELFRGKGPREWRATYAGAFDWGADAGREAVEE